jgi:hypothetical protein
LIQIFRKNWFVFSLLLLPYTVLTRLWIFFEQPEEKDFTQKLTPFYQYISQFLPSSHLYNVMIACFLVFLCAVLLNNIVIKNRITREMNLIPGMLLILLSSFHKETFNISPMLVSSLLLLFGFANVYRIYHRPFAGIYIFNAGFLIGLASLIYVPHILFAGVLVAALFILRKVHIRDFVQLLTGLVIVIGFWGFICFWYELPFYYLETLPENFYLANHFKVFKLNEIIILIILVISTLLSIIRYKSFVIKKSIQSQKKVELLYYMLGIGFVNLILSPHSFLFHALFLIYIPLSVFLAMLMNRVRNEPALELAHLFLLFFVVFSHFLF